MQNLSPNTTQIHGYDILESHLQMQTDSESLRHRVRHVVRIHLQICLHLLAPLLVTHRARAPIVLREEMPEAWLVVRFWDRPTSLLRPDKQQASMATLPIWSIKFGHSFGLIFANLFRLFPTHSHSSKVKSFTFLSLII